MDVSPKQHIKFISAVQKCTNARASDVPLLQCQKAASYAAGVLPFSRPVLQRHYLSAAVQTAKTDMYYNTVLRSKF